MHNFLEWLNGVPPWAQRLATAAAALGAGALAIAAPSTAPVALPVATALAGWLLPHTADVTRLARARSMIAKLATAELSKGPPP
jgi:hypothetical protein